jgi:ABC-type uncharacterized transport system permease subunit
MAGISPVWLGLHVAAPVIGAAGFGAAFLSGVLYLWEQRALKTKRFGRWMGTLPSLDVLDRLAVHAIVVGVVFLGAGIVSGIYLAHEVWHFDWTGSPKFVFSMVTWGWYAALLLTRWRAGWRGARFLALMVVGFLLLLFTLAGIFFFFAPVRGAPWT